jgi:hypothetical protein
MKIWWCRRNRRLQHRAFAFVVGEAEIFRIPVAIILSMGGVGVITPPFRTFQ